MKYQPQLVEYTWTINSIWVMIIYEWLNWDLWCFTTTLILQMFLTITTCKTRKKTFGSSIVFDNCSIWLFLFQVSSVVLNNTVMHAWDFESCDSWSFADVPKTFLFGGWNSARYHLANYHEGHLTKTTLYSMDLNCTCSNLPKTNW